MKLRCGKKTWAALAAFLILAAPVVACSQKGGAEGRQADSAVQAAGSGSASRTTVVGKVTAVVGNQVTLAVGSLNKSGSGSSGFRRRSSEASSSSAAASSGASSSSSLITLTGETKALLIPVGLTLSNSRSTGSGTSGQRSGASGNAAGGFGGGTRSGSGQTGGAFGGGSASRAGGSTRTSGSGGTTGTTGLTQQRSSDFSSITKGMILQIVEETLSDGTEDIVSVSVLSK